jgi:hypothetical protein
MCMQGCEWAIRGAAGVRVVLQAAGVRMGEYLLSCADPFPASSPRRSPPSACTTPCIPCERACEKREGHALLLALHPSERPQCSYEPSDVHAVRPWQQRAPWQRVAAQPTCMYVAGAGYCDCDCDFGFRISHFPLIRIS